MGWTASDFERLDPRLFRSFLAVVRTHSFSAAAVAASLTQGAVSQQVAKLEERLGSQLFLRTGARVAVTPAGHLLSEYAQVYMDHATRFLERLNEEFESLRGLVRYAMPESCIHAPHLGWLLERRKENPGLVLHIELKPAAEVLSDLQAGEIDFGLVNQDVRLQNVESYPFCYEEYLLLQSGSGPEIAAPRSLSDLLSLPFVLYPGATHCLNHWARVRYGGADPISPLALRTQGQFNDVRGVLAMVEGGLGVTVLPRHVAQPALEDGRLRVVGQHGPQDAFPPVLQQISIVRLKERLMPARVKRVMRWLLDMRTEFPAEPVEFLQ